MNEKTRTIDESTETLNGKTKTPELMIIVNGPVDDPYYSIRYYDLSDNEWHIGFSSHYLSCVMDWKNRYFEIVGPVEHVESAKSTGTSKVKEFWQKVKQKYESKGGQYIDRVFNDIVEETIKDMEGGKEMIDVEGGKEMIDVENYDTEINWEAEYKSLQDEADVMYKNLEQAHKELDCKNQELIQLKSEISDLRRKNYYLDGKTDAYEYAIKCFEKGER